MGRFEIQVNRIPEGINHYSFAAEAEDFDLLSSFTGPVRVEADLERRGRQFLVDGHVQTTGHFTCDRCLAEFESPVEGLFRVLIMPEGTAPVSEQQDDEVRLIPSDSQVVALDEDVRECIVLTVPVKLLCSDECLGLCPRCGKNLNDGPCTCERDDTDPRWEPLRKLSRS